VEGLWQHLVMPSRRQKHLLLELAALPWWFSAALAVATYAAQRWVLPTIAAPRSVLGQLVPALQQGANWIALVLIAVAAISACKTLYRRRLLDVQSGIDSLQSLSWEAFEHLVGEVYRRQGFTVEEIGGRAPDGGIDLLLHRHNRKSIVQCKRWKTTRVGVVLIREFYGILVSEAAERGIFVTTGSFTSDALEFAQGKPIELVDGAQLASLVRQVQLSQSADRREPVDRAVPGGTTGLTPGPHPATRTSSLPPVALRPASAAAPTCPRCGSTMIARQSKRGAHVGKRFWGCTRFPGCRAVLEMQPELRREGASASNRKPSLSL
jgi:restriction system protein